MTKNVKKVVATLMATMTVMTVMAGECFAAGNGRIGVKYYTFNWGTKKVYVGDVNEDGKINNADLELVRYVGDYGKAFWKAEKVWDCNGDGYINGDDADALQSYIRSH